jgi:hypothetical protein
MRRSLVLGDERAFHPFLQSLPPHVRRGEPMHPLRAAEQPSRSDEARNAISRWRGEALGAAARWSNAALAATGRVRSKKMGLSMNDARSLPER